MSAFRAQLQACGVPYLPLLERKLWKPLRDIAVDGLVVLLAVAATRCWYWLAPMAIVAIGNRQRALGNILHDAGHGNLHRSRRVNDAIARLLLAPLIFASLSHYRTTHFRHHLYLGDPLRDPDYLHPLESRVAGWRENYLRRVFVARNWWGSVAGHLGMGKLPIRSRIAIAAWWLGCMSLITSVAGTGFVGCFLILWLVARATIFHLILTFREMCDHFGPVPFTRDILRRGLWTELIHPRNNGYHLTHHLLPAVPYYHLPAAQRLFSTLPAYYQSGRTFHSYLLGEGAVVVGWRTGSPA